MAENTLEVFLTNQNLTMQSGRWTALLLIFFATASLTLATPNEDAVAAKRAEIASLKVKAKNASNAVRKLSAETDLTSSAEAIKLLKKYTEELSEVHDRLEAIEAELKELKAGKAETAPQAPVAKKKGFAVSGFSQFQYQGTDKQGASTFDAFRIRRARLTVNYQHDSRASLKLSEELATGANNGQAFLKDAVLSYDLSPGDAPNGQTMLIMGQYPLPIGYELSRSDVDREFPERALYNQTYFSGERSRGFLIRHGVTNELVASIGAFNSLTNEDPEQANLSPGTGNRLAILAAVRTPADRKAEIGVSGFFGHRAAYTAPVAGSNVTSPETERRFVYVDGRVSDVLVPKMTLRGEAMFGRDRLPNATPSASATEHEVRGFQTQLGYDITDQHEVFLRYEQMDPNTGTDGDAVHGYGLAYRYRFNVDTLFTLSHEIFEDNTRVTQHRYGITTVRFTLRF